VGEEVATGGNRRLNALTNSLVIMDKATGGKESIDVGRGLLDVALDVHRETRSLGKSETEVESDSTGDCAESDEKAPAEVDVVRVARSVGDDWQSKKVSLASESHSGRNTHSAS